ncbi:MAG: NAD-dependent epimerase/dehydratase family protein, partial [Actinomycetota bacterium]
MRVLLIGGTVFIGRVLAAELVGAGHEVCYVHRGEHESDGLPAGEHIHVDRKDLASVGGDIASFRPEAVVDNVALSRQDAETALEALPTGIRLAVTSSMDVYRAYTYVMRNEAAEPVPIDETSAVRDERYPYRGQGDPRFEDYEKLDVEEVYLAAGATVLRLPMVYGEHDGQRREEFVLRRVRAGRKQIPVGPGSWLATKGYVGDVARGMRLALEADAAGEIFNLGESRTYPMGQWARMILDAAGSDAELTRVACDKLPEDLGLTAALPQHLLVDSGKARRVLGWQDTDPTETLRRSVAWHLEHAPEGASEDFSADDD